MKFHRPFTVIAVIIILFCAAVPLEQVSAAPNTMFNYVQLSLVKTAAASVVPMGQPVSFTLTIQNWGLITAENVVLRDVLPVRAGLNWTIVAPVPAGCQIDAGVLVCTAATVPNGKASITITSPTTAGSCGLISNTATISASNEPADQLGDNTSSAEIQVTCPTTPLLSIEKTADAPEVDANHPVGFMITVSNTGNGAANNVVIEDQLDPALHWTVASGSGCTISAGQLLSCSIASLAAGGNAVVHVTAPSTTADCRRITNTASVRQGNDEAIFSDPAATTVTCPTAPLLSIEKTADAPEVDANDPVGFLITVNNTGNGAANNVVIEDQLDPALHWTVASGTGCTISGGQLLTCTIASLAVDASAVVHVTAPSTTADCRQITNTASVREGDHDRLFSDPAVTTVTCPSGFDVTISKIAEQTSVDPGGLVQFTMTVSNTGPDVAPSVILTDALPNTAGLNWSFAVVGGGQCAVVDGVLSCDFGSLNAGASRSVTVSSTAGPGSCGTVHNTASVVADGEPADRLFDNIADATVSVTCTPWVNVKITKTTAKPILYQGETLIFSMEVSNDSPLAAQGVVLDDPLPTVTGLSWEIVAPIPAGCAIAANHLTCDYGSLGSGETRRVSISSPTDSTVGTILNTATVSATNETAGFQVDNVDSAEVMVPLGACLSLSQFNGVYSNDFENQSPGQIGIQNYRQTTAPSGQQFMGRFSSETSSLTVTCLPAHSYLLVTFDLYIIQTWDGNTTGVGPDHWKLDLAGRASPLVDTTFSNWSFSHQAFPGNYPGGDNLYQTGSLARNTLGYASSATNKDTTYRITMLVPHVGDTATFNFSAYGLQGLTDESWGIDNIKVSIPNVTRSWFPNISRVLGDSLPLEKKTP